MVSEVTGESFCLYFIQKIVRKKTNLFNCRVGFVLTLSTRGFSRVRRKISVLAEDRHIFGRTQGTLYSVAFTRAALVILYSGENGTAVK